MRIRPFKDYTKNKLKKDINLTQLCIEHWRRIRDNVSPDRPSGEECKLCVAYAERMLPPMTCSKCPIYHASGEKYCDATPFHEAEEEFLHFPPKVRTRRQKMVDYLVNLKRRLKAELKQR